MHLLTGLPLGGPLLCLLLGVPVSAAYGTAMAQLALAAGLVLTALGWFCARALIDRASRPPTVQRPRTTRGSMP